MEYRMAIYAVVLYFGMTVLAFTAGWNHGWDEATKVDVTIHKDYPDQQCQNDQQN